MRSSSRESKVRMITLVVEDSSSTMADESRPVLHSSTFTDHVSDNTTQTTVNMTNLKLHIPSPTIGYTNTTDKTFTPCTTKIPLVYHPKYNISFFSLEKILHAFDAQKYGKVFNTLSSFNRFTLQQCYSPEHEVTHNDLQVVHTRGYLQSLSASRVVAKIAEVPPLAIFPNALIQWCMLSPMRYAVQGTILASQLALQHGWGINLGGGYHHAKAHKGEGFCVYADIPLAIRKLQLNHQIQSAMIIDLDAHQGNGLPAVFLHPSQSSADEVCYEANDHIHIFDMYNGDIYPQDHQAAGYVTFDYPLRKKTKDESYLTTLCDALPSAIETCHPDIVFYNAGTDIYEADPLGALSISKTGIVVRDEIVFRLCRDRKIPIVMVLSGGYTLESAKIIAESLQNLHDKGLIQLSLDA